MVAEQLGRMPRGLRRVAVRCPFGRPAVIEQTSYLESGEPFPTTYYLTCPAAVARVGRLEDDGGVVRYERLVATDPRRAGPTRRPRRSSGRSALPRRGWPTAGRALRSGSAAPPAPGR